MRFAIVLLPLSRDSRRRERNSRQSKAGRLGRAPRCLSLANGVAQRPFLSPVGWAEGLARGNRGEHPHCRVIDEGWVNRFGRIYAAQRHGSSLRSSRWPSSARSRPSARDFRRPSTRARWRRRRKAQEARQSARNTFSVARLYSISCETASYEWERAKELFAPRSRRSASDSDQ